MLALPTTTTRVCRTAVSPLRRSGGAGGEPVAGRSTTSGSPNVLERLSPVSVSASRPCATTPPSRSSSAWVKPGGISSTWWVTSTSAGASGSCASSASRPHQVLPPAQVEPGGGLVEQQQLRVGHQRPGDLHPLALALGEGAVGAVGEAADAELRQQRAGPGLVAAVVALPPAPDAPTRRR